MKGFLNSRRGSCALSAVCFIALGVFLVGWPDLSRIWICRLLGAALLVTGAVYFISHFRKSKGAAAVFQYDLILGVVLAIIGIWLLTQPDLIVALIQYILGVLLIVHAVLDLQGALNLRSVGVRYWWPAFVIGLITLALGVVIIWNPFAGVNALLMLVGLSLIYDGISDLVILLQLRRAFPSSRTYDADGAMDADVIEGQGKVVETPGDEVDK